MSRNLLVVNALVDSVGRNMYVEPFLASYRGPGGLPVLITLCDFEGRALISSQGADHLHSYQPPFPPDQVITQEKSLAQFKTTGTESILFLAHPVFYGATGKAEGMLVAEIPFNAFIEASARNSTSDTNITTLHGPKGRVWSNKTEERTPVVSTTISLEHVDSSLNSLSLILTVAEPTAIAYASLNALTNAYLTIGLLVLILALVVSQMIGRQLTASLLSLTNTANRVAKQGLLDVRIELHDTDEIGQLATAFNTMLEHLRDAQESLERRVTERTRELQLLNQQLSQEVQERSKAEERAKAYAEVKSVLLREVNHRVKNNLIAIISMLHQEEEQAKKEGKDDYLNSLGELIWRVNGLLTVHRLLSNSEWKPLQIHVLCEKVIHHTLKGLSSPRTLALQVTPTTLLVDSDQAHYLTMVLNELTTNTIKYGLKEQGAITISIGKNPAGAIEIRYRDNGPGFPEAILRKDFTTSGIGFPLLVGLITRSMGGEIVLENDNGAVARISFPEKVHPSPTTTMEE
jgi:two-component sensor histidine kinase/HAMP domain-containing protein